MASPVARERVVLLGAEKQAATSFALAYPERLFLFVSDWPVIDGWDLGNVSFLYANPGQPDISEGEQYVALSEPWIGPLTSTANVLASFRLSSTLRRLSELFPEAVLPIASKPFANGRSIVKGDRWHRPDAVYVGSASELGDMEDPYGCGVVYQPFVPTDDAFIVTGVRHKTGGVQIAVIKVLSEVHCRENVLAAGETAMQPTILERSLEMLEDLRHEGWFTMKWLSTRGTSRLASLRAVPCACIQALRRADLDPLMETSRGVRVAKSGICFLADQHYSSYGALV